MSAVAGLRGTGDWGTDERPKNFREMILFRQPQGDTPMTALMGKAGKQSVDDPEFSWWDESVTLVRLQVNGALTSGDLLVTVDSADPTTSTPTADWGTATHLVPGDILMVEPTTDAASFTPEYVEVTEVLSDTQFTVKRGQCGSSAGSIGNDAYLLKIGSSFAEGTSEPKSASRNPTKFSNLCQIFKTSYEVTETAAATKTRTGDLLKNERMRKSTDHAKALELALMFGRKNETVGANGKPKRSMDGVRRFIPAVNTTVFSAAVTFTGATNNFLEAAYKVFDWETSAGDSRIALCGNGALNELNKIIFKESSTSVQFTDTVKMYGMNLRTLVLPQGTLYLRTHPLLNRHPLYTYSMWLMDFSALKWRFIKGRDTSFKDNIQGDGEDTIRGRWLTEAGLEVRSAGLTLGYLGNIKAN